MGYESRIIITERKTSCLSVWATPIADVRMGAMNRDFTGLFTKEIDYLMPVDGGQTDTDRYGKKMKFTGVKTVVDFLESEIAKGETYRRLPLLLGILKGIDESQWEEIQVVHYGY